MLQAESAEFETRVVSLTTNTGDPISAFKHNQPFKALIKIIGGTAPYTLVCNGKTLGTTQKQLIRIGLRTAISDGDHSIPVVIRDQSGKQASTHITYQIEALKTEPEEPAGSLGTLGTLSLASDDDWGDEDEDEEEVEDPYLNSNRDVYPWTENQSRAIMNTMLPSAVAIGDGEWYYRILHIARERIDDEPMTSFIGLDDNVKIGFQVSYGISENLDVNVQRTNGRSLQVNLNRVEATKMDYYDIIFRYQFMNQHKGDLMDAAIHVGPTLMLRNTGSGEQSFNIGAVVERNFMKDRLRLGAGIVYSSLSVYERTIGKGPDTKLTPDEYDALQAAGSPTPDAVDDHTLAIPLLVKYALTEKQQLFTEVIVPIDGFETRAGPSISAGYRINSNSHEYSVYLSNTGNPSYNGAITGGHDYDEINLFGFFISAYF